MHKCKDEKSCYHLVLRICYHIRLTDRKNGLLPITVDTAIAYYYFGMVLQSVFTGACVRLPSTDYFLYRGVPATILFHCI